MARNEREERKETARGVLVEIGIQFPGLLTDTKRQKEIMAVQVIARLRLNQALYARDATRKFLGTLDQQAGASMQPGSQLRTAEDLIRALHFMVYGAWPKKEESEQKGE
jgi:hypothetical protein